jgi:hypothetical protein
MSVAGRVPKTGRKVSFDMSQIPAGDYAFIVSARRPGSAEAGAAHDFWLVERKVSTNKRPVGTITGLRSRGGFLIDTCGGRDDALPGRNVDGDHGLGRAGDRGEQRRLPANGSYFDQLLDACLASR